MKKVLFFRFLLLSLLVGISGSAWAQNAAYLGSQVTSTDGISDTKRYVLKTGANRYITDNGTDYNVPNDANSATDASIYYLISNGDGTYKIKNYYTGKYWGVPVYNSALASVEEASAGAWSLNFSEGIAYPSAPDAGNTVRGIDRTSGKVWSWSTGTNNNHKVYIYEVLEEATITYGTSTGTFYNGSNAVTSGWIAKWVSNEAGKPAVTLTASATNINAANARMAPGSSTSTTYSFSVGDGYLITGFAMNCPTFGAAVTITPAGESAVAVETGQTIVVNSSASSFVYSGSNTGRIQAGSNDGGSLTISVEKGINVTYNFYCGGDFVRSETVLQTKNSAVNYPASLTTGYSTFAYNFGTSGSIGTTDCTITVTATLKSGLVTTASLSNTKKYKLKCARGGLSTYTDGGGDIHLASPVKTALSVSEKEFAILSYRGHYYLYSVSDEKFVTYSSSSDAPVVASITSETTDAVTFETVSSAVYAIKFNNDGSKYINSSSSYTYGITISDWGGSGYWDDGNQYVIEEVDDFDSSDALAVLDEFFNYTVTYIVKDGSDNVLFTSDPVVTTSGANITTLPAAYQKADFYDYNSINLTISSKGNTNAEFTATPKATPLVKYTADTTKPQWYKMRLNSFYPTYSSEASPNVSTPTTNADDETVQWAFVGEPYAGFHIYCRAAGTSLVLGSGQTTGSANTGGGVHATFATAGTQDNELWFPEASTYLEGAGFYIFNEEGHALNRRSAGSLDYWTSGHDAGSTFVVTEVEMRDVDYAIYFGGSSTGIVQNAWQDVGSATALPTPLVSDYCTVSYSADEVESGSGTQTVNVTITMDAPFQASKGGVRTYYAWHLMEGNSPGYVYIDGSGDVVAPKNGALTLTEPISSTYVWEFSGDPVQGFLIQNLSVGGSKTLGGRTASGGTMAMETLSIISSPRFVPKNGSADRNKWYCINYDYWIDRSDGKPYAHTSASYPSTFVRLYKVRFDKGSSSATLMVGSQEIADPSVDIYLSASATMSCKEAGYYIVSYDGYATLAEALAADTDGEIVLTIVEPVASVTSTAQNKAYNIRTANNRGWWAVASGASVVNSTVGLDLATLSSDTKQQFAFIPIDLDGDTNADEYYLYSIGEQKFVYFNVRSDANGQLDTHLTLSTAPVKSGVTFAASTNGTYATGYPAVMTFPNGNETRSFGVHPSHSPQVYNYAYNNTHLDDEGNASAVVEVGAFDPATALSRLPISSTSSLANNKAYAITCPRGVLGINNRTLISTASPSHTFREKVAAGSATNATLTDPTYTEGTFAIIYHDGTDNGEDDGSYYLWSIEGRGYVNSNGVIDNANPEPIAFNERGNRVFSIYFPNSSSKYIAVTAWGGNENGLNIDAGASSLDDGNCFYICPVDDFDPTDAINIFTPQTVDYVLMYGGDEVGSVENVSARVSGTAEEFLPSSLDNGFMTYTFDPEIITGETATVTVTATWNGPFEIAASFNAATAKWYTVGIHTYYEGEKWTWGYKSSESDKVKVEQLPVNDIANLDNTRLFTFVGDPYSGFYIYNRAAGTKKLYRGGESDEISMTNDGEKFFVAKSAPNPDTQTYFCLKPDGATNYLNLNYDGGKVITGWSDNDNGSTCWVLPSGSYYLNALTPLALDAPVGAVGSKSGILTTSDRDALNTLRTELGTDAFAIPSTTYPFEIVKPIVTAVVASDIVTLTDGGYYRIVSAVPGFNQTAAWYYNPATSTNHITWAKAATTAGHLVNSLFKFKASATEGKWYIYSPNAQKYIIHDGTGFEAQTGSLGDTPGDVTVGDVTGSSTQKTLKINVQTVHANGHASGSGNSGTLINYNSNAVGEPSTWYLVKVDKIDLTLNKATDLNGRTNVYATAKMPFNITLPTGDDTEAMAYTMLAENQATNAGGVLYIKPDELGRRVPKDTPVMLVGTSTGASTQTVRATISDDEDMSDVDVPGSNIFEGTYVPLTSNHGSDATKYLTLGRNNEGGTKVVGFYLLSDGSTIAANRAYIPYSTLAGGGAGVKGFAIAWDFDEDGIGELTEEVKGQMSDVAYDLQGRRVMKPRKGIYIVDGKKVMIK